MTFIKNRVLIFWACIVFTAFAVSTLAPGAQKIKTVKGVEVITNPEKPKAPKGIPSRLVLKEDFSVGDSENLDEMISEVSFFAVDERGTIYAVDIKEMDVKVFDSSGRYVRTIGKKGQGPGELNLPAGILITPEKQLMILDTLNRRMAFFELDGAFVRNVSIADKTSIVNPVMDGKGNIAAMELVVEGNSLFWYIRKYDKDLKPLFDVNKVEFKNPLQGKMNPFDFINLVDFDTKGNLCYGDAKDYVIKVFSPEGKHFRTIAKKYSPTKITKKDIQQMLEAIPDMGGAANIKERMEFPNNYPAYQSFSLDEEGRLFVRSYKRGKEEKSFFLDIFDANGRCISTLETKFSPRIWKKGKMYSIEENADGFKVIKRYSVSWEK